MPLRTHTGGGRLVVDVERPNGRGAVNRHHGVPQTVPQAVDWARERCGARWQVVDLAIGEILAAGSGRRVQYEKGERP